MLRKLIKTCYHAIPPGGQAFLDYQFRRSDLVNLWGGPLNGQVYRQAVVSELLARFRFSRIVETGTFRGSSAKYFCELFSGEIITIEGKKTNYLFARRILKSCANVQIHLSDSVSFLERSVPNWSDEKYPTLFYLDAHWEERLPLREELEIIARHLPCCVIMIDDFKVPNDEGYRYDDYGPGKAITVEYVKFMQRVSPSIFFPSTPSSDESGAKRGFAVIPIGDDNVYELRSMSLLREHAFV